MTSANYAKAMSHRTNRRKARSMHMGFDTSAIIWISESTHESRLRSWIKTRHRGDIVEKRRLMRHAIGLIRIERAND